MARKKAVLPLILPVPNYSVQATAASVSQTKITVIRDPVVCYFIVAACLWWTVSPAVAALAVLGALLSDIDIPTSAVGRPLFPIACVINQQMGHRTLTHSLLGMGILGLVAAPLLIFSRAELYWALLIGYLSHILIDTENKMEIELLWPSRLRAWFFKDEKYRIQVGSKGVSSLRLSPLLVLLDQKNIRGP